MLYIARPLKFEGKGDNEPGTYLVVETASSELIIMQLWVLALQNCGTPECCGMSPKSHIRFRSQENWI